jgi:hypothetical protein
MREMLNLDSPVYCQDGRYGRLTRVAVCPDTWQVRELIVE